MQKSDPIVTSSRPPGDLRDVAWGENPDRWPLPSQLGAVGGWERAVALAGQGRYASARAELATAERTPTATWTASLMASTRASWLRQIGSHVQAARYDGAAIALVGLGGGEAEPMTTAARCDALTGLGADALGSGRFPRANTLLDRCQGVLDELSSPSVLWRQHLRLQWVRAELAMVSGDGESALRHALAAEELATDTVSLRHRTKTDLIVAAARCSVGDVDTARRYGLRVWEACSERGLVPLQWASAMLLGSLGDARRWESAAADCAAVLRRRGGVVAGA